MLRKMNGADFMIGKRCIGVSVYRGVGDLFDRMFESNRKPLAAFGMYCGLLLAIVLLTSLQSDAQILSREQYLQRFEQRRQTIVHQYDTVRNPGISGAAVRYALNTDLKTADSLLLHCDHIVNPKGDMFWMFTVIGTYLHGKGKMSPAAESAVRNTWKTYAPYRGDTENHWCLYYSSLFLAAEQWPDPDGASWYNGKSSGENIAEAKEYLLHWMKITTTIGQGEFDSPTYFPEYAIPMLLLAEFALDAEIRTKAGMMADYLFLDFAVDHLDGMMLGGNAREGAGTVIAPRTASASDFAWLYFLAGGERKSGWLLFPALSSYRLPEIVYRIATDRSAPYVNRERKRVRNVIRYGAEKNPPVYKYSYVASDYGLSSLQGGILQPIQQHTWSLRYSDGTEASTVFALHPYWSGEELATFFPEERKALMSDVVKSKGTYNKDTKWTGGSPFERIFQHRNTLMALYDIPPGTTSEHIDAFFPSTLEKRETDSSGWIFCKAGNVYIAWFPLRPGEWLRLPEDNGHNRFRSHALRNGYVMETRDAKEAGSYEKFVVAVRRRKPVAQFEKGEPGVEYTTIGGDRLSFRYPDDRRVNGRGVNLANTPLFESPFATSAAGSGKLVLKHGTLRRVLDFNAGRIED
jgi:hypothetical protein